MSEPRDLVVHYHGECQLMDWAETRTSGAWIKLRLPDPELLAPFRGMDTATAKRTGHILNVTITEGDIIPAEDEPEKPAKAHGAFWRDLMAAGFFRAPKVLRAIGTEKQFEAWIREQPSVIDGNADWDGERGEGRCEPAHIRSVAEGSGTAEKPPYFATPMTHKQHQLQHDKGYSAVTGLPEGEAMEYLAKKADHYRMTWASLTLAEKLAPHVSSRAEVHPSLVTLWAEENGLTHLIPSKWREAS